MKIDRLYTGFFFNAAFFSIVPHGSELTRLWFEILVATDIFGPMTQDAMIKAMSLYWRQKRDPELRAGTTYLTASNYLTKKGTRYHLTDRSMLLIAQVERKLKKLVEEHCGVNPVGRPPNAGK